MPRAIERYELETLYDVYKEQNPTLNDEGLAKVYQYVEKLINYAYEDKAPPEVSHFFYVEQIILILKTMNDSSE